MRILNTLGKTYSVEAHTILSRLGKVTYQTQGQKQLEANIEKYDIAIIGLGVFFTAPVFKKGKNLKAIVSATTGLDHIDLREAKRRGVGILSLRGETKFLNTITGTAELAMGLMIDLLRRTPHAFDSVKRYEWNREAFRGHNLYGQTLGIVGLGRLGRLVARYGEAFGMRVLFCDPRVEKTPRRACGKVPFEK